MTILIVTNTNDPTADFVINKFIDRGVPFLRLNTDTFLTDVSHRFSVGSGSSPYSMSITVDSRTINTDTVRGVWYRRPKEPVPSSSITDPEAIKFCTAEASYLLKCLYMLLDDRKWVSHPKAISYANVKLHQLEIARQLGFLVPKSICTNDPDTALKFIRETGNVVIKPFKTNVVDTEDGPAVIYTSRVGEDSLKELGAVRFAPHFFQEEIRKTKEYRVTIIGKEVFVTSINSQSDPNLLLDWRTSSDKPKQWSADTLPDEILKKCFAMIEVYDLNYGAFDFALTPDGDIIFFELNPNGQWAWQEDYLGLPMTNALIKALGY